MRFLVSFVSATALLASGIYAADNNPTTPGQATSSKNGGSSRPPSRAGSSRPPSRAGKGTAPVPPEGAPNAPPRTLPSNDYEVELAIQKWFREPHTADVFSTAADTSGGWETWAQVELERIFKEDFDDDFKKDLVKGTRDIREQSYVYQPNSKTKRSPIADFVLPQTTDKKGMIIELKVELKPIKGNDDLKERIENDKSKERNVAKGFEDFSFVTLALAFTPEAHGRLEQSKMKKVPGASVKFGKAPNQRTMVAYYMKHPEAQAGISASVQKLIMDLNEGKVTGGVTTPNLSPDTSPERGPDDSPLANKGKKPSQSAAGGLPGSRDHSQSRTGPQNQAGSQAGPADGTGAQSERTRGRPGARVLPDRKAISKPSPLPPRSLAGRRM
ncbi:hypothetical protein DM02DRAFT_655120 [Periconia macrospinosa]|uniref:Uncharacterized protein n=1 Tax=Periconia macrospinosa TaxID=97972 RepID=A0A2V1DRF4_9PLEO|nr:hypothetical protein DM02DRAFT_655120 [Periconia macrospinosa]